MRGKQARYHTPCYAIAHPHYHIYSQARPSRHSYNAHPPTLTVLHLIVQLPRPLPLIRVQVLITP